MRKRTEAVSPVVATILMVAMTVVLTALLYIMVMGMIGNFGGTPRIGAIKPRIVDSTTLDVEFTKIDPPARPIEIEIMIGVNESQGRYTFTSNGDGELAFAGGVDLCDIYYTDNADDNYVSSGDYLRVSNVPQGSVVRVWVLDSATGEMIDTEVQDLPG